MTKYHKRKWVYRHITTATDTSITIIIIIIIIKPIKIFTRTSQFYDSTLWGPRLLQILNKKLRYCRETARCVLSVVILPITTQQCRNYLYDKSWPNWWYEVGGLVGGNVSWTMCTQPWRDQVGSHCLRCHKQTDDGRIVYITCIPTTCCGEIF